MKEYLKPEVDFVSLIAKEVIANSDDDALEGEWGDESSIFG